jgi:hypothetical protein
MSFAKVYDYLFMFFFRPTEEMISLDYLYLGQQVHSLSDGGRQEGGNRG